MRLNSYAQHRACGQVRLSTLRYSRAKLAVYPDREPIRSASGCQLPSVVKELRSVQSLPIGTSPRPAERDPGLEPTSREIKNPASSAGLIRPLLQPLEPTQPSGRMCSMLDFFLPGVRNQPHLMMRRQTRSVSRLPGRRGPYPHQVSIASPRTASSAPESFFGNTSVKITKTCANSCTAFARSHFRVCYWFGACFL